MCIFQNIKYAIQEYIISILQNQSNLNIIKINDSRTVPNYGSEFSKIDPFSNSTLNLIDLKISISK